MKMLWKVHKKNNKKKNSWRELKYYGLLTRSIYSTLLWSETVAGPEIKWPDISDKSETKQSTNLTKLQLHVSIHNQEYGV